EAVRDAGVAEGARIEEFSRLSDLGQQLEARQLPALLSPASRPSPETDARRSLESLAELAPVEPATSPMPTKPAEAKIVELAEQPQQPQPVQDLASRLPASPPAEPLPEIPAADNPFSTFSLNVADVTFKLAAASLDQGQLPAPGSVRSEEFVNAFDYRDPEPAAGEPVGFVWERARFPFAHNREVLRFALKTAATGRETGRPLNLVLLLDSSGSMERADRVNIVKTALNVLGTQLQPQDQLSVVTFSSVATLRADGATGDDARQALERATEVPPEGGTNLEDALRLAYETAQRHFLNGGVNRVVMLTDGAANLGNVAPEDLQALVEANRREGVALDAFGIGWEGYNDDLLEVLSRNGDGRYGFINTPEAAASDFAGQLAGALQVAAADVKVQVEFNPARVETYRQVGYQKHQLTKEQFRDNTVDAAEIGAAEEGNALYLTELKPEGQGPIGTLRVRYRVPATGQYEEHEWLLDYSGPAPRLEEAGPALRLATVAASFAEWLNRSPFAGEVTLDRLQALLRDIPATYPRDPRPQRLADMLQQARSLSGR
ncbi:MAG: von Willebrand factor type A domain-containing protein, partial [Verrucomicrobiae bacterium]|nr:von Willebrand factor type A domain-containing protein [Verrucomicrobiae bacterium]